MIGEPFITQDELEDLLDYERHEHSSDPLVRKILKAIGQQLGFGEKRVVSAFKTGDLLVTELFWKAFDRVLEAQEMRDTIGRINRSSYCQDCNAFHLWYDPLNSKAANPSEVISKLAPAVLSLELPPKS